MFVSLAKEQRSSSVVHARNDSGAMQTDLASDNIAPIIWHKSAKRHTKSPGWRFCSANLRTHTPCIKNDIESSDAAGSQGAIEVPSAEERLLSVIRAENYPTGFRQIWSDYAAHLPPPRIWPLIYRRVPVERMSSQFSSSAVTCSIPLWARLDKHRLRPSWGRKTAWHRKLRKSYFERWPDLASPDHGADLTSAHRQHAGFKGHGELELISESRPPTLANPTPIHRQAKSEPTIAIAGSRGGPSPAAKQWKAFHELSANCSSRPKCPNPASPSINVSSCPAGSVRKEMGIVTVHNKGDMLAASS